MLSMAVDSAKRFCAGKLFQDNAKAVRQLLTGAGVGVIAMVVAGQFLPVWVAALIGGTTAGALQPLLFKDLKYA